MRLTGATFLALILLAGHACTAAPRPLLVAFEPKPGKPFVLRFASADPRNCYALTFEPQGRTLELKKTVNGREVSLGAAPELPRFTTIGVWQRQREIRVEADGRTVLLSGDTSFRSPRWALEPPAATATPVRVASPDDIALDDDFENADATRERWTAELGAWRVRSRYDELAERTGGPPMFSVYQPVSEGLALASAGQAHWADLSLTALVHIHGRRRAGLAFNILDRANFAAFVIEARADGTGVAQLLDFRNGSPAELAAFEPLPLEQDQWYGLRVETYACQAWCSIRGLGTGGWRTVIGGVPGCPATGCGRVGMVSFGAGAQFDDVSVRPLDSFVDTLESPRPSRWKLDGHWQYRGGALEGSCMARLLDWPRGVSRIDVELVPHDGGGIFCNAPTGQAYSAFGLFGGEWQFQRVMSGKPAVLARTPAQLGKRYSLTVLRSPGLFECFVNGLRVFDVCDIGMPDYGGGLLAEGAGFTCFRVAEAPPRGGAVILATDFSGIEAADAVSGRKRLILPEILEPTTPAWHLARDGDRTALASGRAGRALFREALPAAVSVSARLTGNSPGGVLVAAGPESGYRLSLADSGRAAVLYRNDFQILKRPVRDHGGTVELFLARRCGRILAFVNGQPLIAYADPAPLRGNQVGLAADGPATFRSLLIRADDASQHSFRSFNPAWLQRGGDWLLHGGRLNDSPADWITGDARHGEAWLVERAARKGAFTWYLTVSPATEGYADGGSKTFPIANVCLRLGARSWDEPETGYAVMLRPGGKNEIVLLNGSARVASAELAAPENRPLRLKIERSKQHVNVSINGVDVLMWDGAAPPSRGHLAIGLHRSHANFSRMLILPHSAAP